MQQQIQDLAKALLGGNVVVLTGAGMSTDSGIPDFRETQKSLWAQKPEELGTVDALYNNNAEFTVFYRDRIAAVEAARPCPAHHLLAKWQKAGHLNTIFTQNVDDLHEEAGAKVRHLHGEITVIRCQDCDRNCSTARYRQSQFCPACGGRRRPDVVLFGEKLPTSTWSHARIAAGGAKLFLVLGSSLSVEPANMLPGLTQHGGGKLAIINQTPTLVDEAFDIVIQGNLSVMMAAVDKLL